jgi:hypothetical protein
LYKKILVSDLIIDGQRLVTALARNRFPIVSALWSYNDESLEWRLVIVSPTVDHAGPMAAYGRVQRVLAASNPSRLTLTDVALVSPQSSDYENLRMLVSSPGRFGTGLPTGSANGAVFEDAYVYQL